MRSVGEIPLEFIALDGDMSRIPSHAYRGEDTDEGCCERCGFWRHTRKDVGPMHPVDVRPTDGQIDPQIKRGVSRDYASRETCVVWRLYYFTHSTWSIPATWTCDTRVQARWFAFTHQWIRIGGAVAGLTAREIGRLIAESVVLA